MAEQSIFRILLVEDDHYIAKVIALGMESLGVPFHIEHAFSAEEGFDLWKEQPYNILLTDYNLRGTNGISLIEQVKQLSGSVPTVLFTAYDTQQTRREAKQAGVSAYIAKPFMIDEFVNLIRTLIPPAATEREAGSSAPAQAA